MISKEKDMEENKTEAPVGATSNAKAAQAASQPQEQQIFKMLPQDWEKLDNIRITERTGWTSAEDWQRPLSQPEFKEKLGKSKWEQLPPPKSEAEELHESLMAFSKKFGYKYLVPTLLSNMTVNLHLVQKQLREMTQLMANWLQLEAAKAQEILKEKAARDKFYQDELGKSNEELKKEMMKKEESQQ